MQIGVADAWYSGSERDLWCEHKRLATLPGTINLTSPSITQPHQIEWLKARHAEGRNVSMIVFVDGALKRGTGCLLLHGLDWMTPITREEFLAKAKTRSALADEIVAFVGQRQGT
jgi:hypothetical protein